MKSRFTLFLLFVAIVGGAQQLLGQDDPNTYQHSMGFLPGFKSAVLVDQNERNPYANREKKTQIAQEEGDTEAARIREILQGLRVRGTSVGPRGLRVLFGDLVLIEGQELPPLLPGQMDRLICTRVTEADVELAWLTESGRQIADGRKLLITIDQEIKVEFILKGQINTPEKQRALLTPGGLGEADVRPIEVAAPTKQP